jgi:uncharacterized pyridoxal phosphate-containing UPF0001 family protein
MKNINITLQCLKKVRDEVCQALGVSCDKLELSMGMSDDFEHAVSYISSSYNWKFSWWQYTMKSSVSM